MRASPLVLRCRLAWPLAGGLLVLMAATAFGGDLAGTEQALTNLCSGPPADPLPPLRANRPSAAEMAAQPRQHPYLFFDAGSRQALRDRAKAEPFRSLAERLRTHAEACLKRQIPPMARLSRDCPAHLPDGSYNPEWLRHNYDESSTIRLTS